MSVLVKASPHATLAHSMNSNCASRAAFRFIAALNASLKQNILTFDEMIAANAANTIQAACDLLDHRDFEEKEQVINSILNGDDFQFQRLAKELLDLFHEVTMSDEDHFSSTALRFATPTPTTLKVTERILFHEVEIMYQLARDAFLSLLLLSQMNPCVELDLERLENLLRQLAAFKSVLATNYKLYTMSDPLRDLHRELSAFEIDRNGTVLQYIICRSILYDGNSMWSQANIA